MNSQKIGEQLIKHSLNEPISVQDKITEMFPYIYVAAERMSSRKISEWLEENHKIKIHHSSIASALRQSDTYLQKYVDTACNITTSILHFFATSPELVGVDFPSFFQILTRSDSLDSILENLPSISDQNFLFGDLQFLTNKLDKEWYSLPDIVRNRCEDLIAKWTINNNSDKQINEGDDNNE